MIKVNKNDSIVDIIIQIRNCKEKEIILEFPFSHPVLHNYTSLKILKTKAGKKNIIIITNDKTAKKIWKKLGIQYSLINSPDLLEYNYSFWEYFWYTIKKYFSNIKNYKQKNLDNNILYKYQKKYWNAKIGFFIGFLSISIILLLFIFYFAVNKTYVYIRPEIEIELKHKNFVFKYFDRKVDEIELDDNVIKLKKIEKEVSLKSNFWTSGIKWDEAEIAKWTVILYNLSNENIKLKKNTRLQSASWVVFLLENWINIPKTIIKDWEKNIWETTAKVTARVLDANWKITWKRWNVKAGTLLVIPWLSSENQKNIYAKTKINFTWWKENYIKILTENDIKNAKEMLKLTLEKKAIKDIKAELEKDNEINNVKYEILWTDKIINFSDYKIEWLDNLKIWDEIGKFELFWSLKITTYIYNRELLISKMTKDIKAHVLTENENLENINNESLKIVKELSRTTKPFSIKATAEIEALFIQNFLNQKSSYVNKLKNQIIWLNKDKAEKILINNEKISNADIKIKPFFIQNISNIDDNIIFEVKE